jgi:hypothetical protein
MDRCTRSTVARRIAVALVLSLCAAGCAGNSYFAFSSGGSAAVTSVPAGTSASTATVQASSSANSWFALGMMLLLAYDNQMWTEELAKYGYVTVPVPPLDETRKVNTQDCGKPIEDPSANLRCR